MEVLYNGIRLPSVWPPRYDAETLRHSMPVPYLVHPPEVIDVSMGRQLFVDDFLIEETSLQAVSHRAVKDPRNPVLFAETPWEREEALPCACPKSGGIWYDRGKFRMWYEAGWLHKLCYAESEDGLHWARPSLDIVPGTNQILPYAPREMNAWGLSYTRPDSTAVVIDPDVDPGERYKMLLRSPGGGAPALLLSSPDGIHWDRRALTSEVYDRTTMFYNPFRKKWICSIRDIWRGRCRDYAENSSFFGGADFSASRVHWLCCDTQDLPDPYIGFPPQLYNVDCVGYESLMLGMFQIMLGPENDVCQKTGAPKITELQPMFSRDGFHFTRPFREALIPAARIQGTWDRGYVQSVGGVCLIHGDELWIYYAGFSGDPSKARQNPACWDFDGMYSGGATGLARLRRDGFVSREGSGTLTTRLLRFSGKHAFFVNASGALTVQLLDARGHVLAQSRPAGGDSTKMRVDFGDFSLSSLENTPFRLRFTLDGGALYAFWFSADDSGESGGMPAGGKL